MKQRKTVRFMGFVWILGALLLVPGLCGLWLGAGALKQNLPGWGGGLLVAGVACLAAGAGVLRWGMSQQAKWASAAPWRSRPDWAKGLIPARENAASAFGLGLPGGVMTLAAACLIFLPEGAFIERGLKYGILVLGVALSSGAVYVHRLRRKYGKSVFELSAVPGVIGGALEGAIKISVAFPERSTFQLHLQCLKLQSRRWENENNSTGSVLWQSDWQTVPGRSDPAGCRVPVHFEVPPGPPESEAELVPERVLWQLTAKALAPGPGYATHFEVPMFTVESSAKTAAVINGGGSRVL